MFSNFCTQEERNYRVECLANLKIETNIGSMIYSPKVILTNANKVKFMVKLSVNFMLIGLVVLVKIDNSSFLFLIFHFGMEKLSNIFSD
jgi:hypothetical protein